jgi:hypothetical protein
MRHLVEFGATAMEMLVNKCDKVTPQQMRKIKPTRRSVSGSYAFRGDSAIQFESTLERDFIIRNEFSLNVLDIIPQPVQISFKGFNGRFYHYTPDFLVYYRLGNMPYGSYPKPLLVEVKPRKKLQEHWIEWKPKFMTALKYAKEQGWNFRIYDESRIRDQALKNIVFLQRYQRMIFPIEENNWIVSNVKDMGIAPFHYLLSRHFMGAYRAEGIAQIYHLIATRQLECDISKPLNDLTELWVPDYE